MARLIDGIARRRTTYPSFMVGVPYAVVLDIPQAMRGSGLALDRYYVVLAETELELAEFEAFLAASQAGRAYPDLLDNRSSSMRSDGITMIRYDPPQPGWPWLSVCRWPSPMAGIEGSTGSSMARGCYTFEAFTSEGALVSHQGDLLQSLSRARSLTVQMISRDRLCSPGSA